MIKTLIILLTVFFTISVHSFDQKHSKFAEVLSKVSYPKGNTTVVDYKLLKSDSAKLDSYLADLSGLTKSDYDKFSREQKIAFLINAYNAFTLKLIIDNYPVKSIKDITVLFFSPWKKKFFKLFGEERHLDYIEHDVLRKDFSEARIHFAIVCASKGCPPLIRKPFTGMELNKMLDNAAINFLNDKAFNYYDNGKNKLYLSSIFKWFGGDFDKKYGSVKSFVIKYMKLDEAAKSRVIKEDSEISYLDYDWSLNER